MAVIKKINASGTEYDICASELQTESIIGTNSTIEATNSSATLNFKYGAQEAVIELNSKGNIAVESLNKHVNIEAAKGIQMKPTTNVIFDSSRRILNGKGNEVLIECKFDDYEVDDSELPIEYISEGSRVSGADEQWAELKINSRNIDLRCHDHGGIALLTCGKDGDNNENKIKFESSRSNAITESGGTYTNEGGKGLEFGTFNNLHTSIFTKDYRFNKDGIVYAVTRENPTLNGGKFDYPTQADDFKDIINSSLSVTWEDIVNCVLAWKASQVN